MKLTVYKKDGSKSADSVTIPDELLKAEPNDHAIWLAVRSEEAAGRQGTHKTKTRSEVNGSTKKPFKQKGTGRARQGRSRSPLHPGGSTMFGPQPHTYQVKLPIKVRRLARLSAFLYKAKADKIMVVEDFKLSAPKTQDMATIFNALGLSNEKILFLIPEYDSTISKSVRNLERANMQKAVAASTRDLMDCSTILVQKSAMQSLVEGLNHVA